MSAETGRFLVKKAGRTFLVEPLTPRNTQTGWGDVNPATGKVEGNYGDKYKGSIEMSESLITEDNGFKNIVVTKVGVSPASVIDNIINQR